MAKDVKKTQKKNVKEENKQPINKVAKVDNTKKQPKKEVVKEKKTVVEEKFETKEIIKEKKKDNVKFVNVVKKVDDNRKAILFGVVGFLIATLLFRFILWPDRIATLSDGTQPVVNINGEPYTADQLYEDMKKNYSISVLLDEIDNIILSEKYPEDEEMKKAVSDNAEYYYSVYESYYGYTKEEFLSNSGFTSEAQFLERLTLDYRRNQYYEDYAKGLVSKEEIDKYYENDVFGDVDSKHILVKVDKEGKNGLTDADAKKMAQEIIKKLDNGTTWDDIIKEYGDKIVNEKLGYMAFNASLESSYLKECKNLEVGKYSKTPVLTSYGYHIVFKIDQKDKPKLSEVKEDIIEVLANKEKDNDKKLKDKSLISMREDAKLEFVDTVFGDAYKNQISQYK